jgi:hypothetical protein
MLTAFGRLLAEAGRLGLIVTLSVMSGLVVAPASRKVPLRGITLRVAARPERWPRVSACGEADDR